VHQSAAISVPLSRGEPKVADRSAAGLVGQFMSDAPREANSHRALQRVNKKERMAQRSALETAASWDNASFNGRRLSTGVLAKRERANPLSQFSNPDNRRQQDPASLTHHR